MAPEAADSQPDTTSDRELNVEDYDFQTLPFSIPNRLSDLEHGREGELFVEHVPDSESLNNDIVDSAFHECASKLANGPLQILDQETFDATYTVVRSLELLDVKHATKFVAIMSQNLGVLVTSGLEELAAEGFEKSHPVVTAHRSAIHAYAFFISCMQDSFRTRVAEAQKTELATKGPKKRGGKAKATRNDDAEDELAAAWPGVSERIMKALHRTLKANLDETLYRSATEKCRLVQVCVLAAVHCLGDSVLAKQASTLTICVEVVALSASRHSNANGCVDFTAQAMFDLVKTHDEGPKLAIQAATLAANQYKSFVLGKALLAKFCDSEPETYDDIAARDVTAAKRPAEMLSLMALALPAVVHANMSQLMPYFGCRTAVTVRSNLVACMGHLMAWYMSRGMDEKGSKQLQMSRQNAVQTLVSRVNDVHAVVRKSALNIISGLAHKNHWPLEYIVIAAKAAVARLDDGALASAAALDLLCHLVVLTRAEKLRDSYLVASLNRFEEQLKGMQPDVVEEDEQEDGPQWEAGALGDETAQQQAGQQALAGEDPPAVHATQQGIVMPTQINDAVGQPDAVGPTAPDAVGVTYSQMRFLVASLKELLELSRTLAAALPEVEALLASDSTDGASNAIKLLTLCSQLQLQGASESWRRVWHLVFSTSEKVRKTVLEAFENYLLPGGSAAGVADQQRKHVGMLNKLVAMVEDLALCDQEALEELIRLAVTMDGPLLGSDLIRMMFRNLHAAVGAACATIQEGGEATEQARAAADRLSLLCSMVARHAPQLVVQDVKNLIASLNRSHVVLKDALLVRRLAMMLKDMAPTLHASAKGSSAAGGHQPASHIPLALSNLLSVLVSGHLPECGGSWPPAAQAAVAAIYRLHPEPHRLLGPLLQHLAGQLAGGRTTAAQITRSVFLVGCVATQQLALIDSLVKRVRQERLAQERKAAEKPLADDMDAQLGTGQAREHQLDALQEELEGRIMESKSLIGTWGRVISTLCHTPALLAEHPELASAAMSALAKLMALDSTYCEDNCPIFFTRLTCGNVKLAPAVRCGMLVALGDLGRRHPNIMEPWTERMFVCLNDENEEVAKTCLRILAHLILSDMTKPKGHMAHVARCLVAGSPAVRDLAVRLFNSLSSKQAKGGANKVYQYLPEIISAVTRGDPMPDQDFKAMMQRLLGYVKVDKLADSLKARLCERFQNVVCEFTTAASGPLDPAGAQAPVAVAIVDGSGGFGGKRSSFDEVVREWRSLADCIALITYSEKGLRACMDLMRCYKHALGDEHVYNVFKGMAEHARRGNRTAELKQEVLEYEARLLEAHTSLREEQVQQAAAAAAAAPAAKAAELATGAAEMLQEVPSDGSEGCKVASAGDNDGREECMNEAGEDPDPGDGNDDAEKATANTADQGCGGGIEQAAEAGATGEGAETSQEQYADKDDDGDEAEYDDDDDKAEYEDENDEDDGQDEDGEPGDDDMEWDEDGRGPHPATPMGRSKGGRTKLHETPASAATPGAAGTPMAITPAPQAFGSAEKGSPGDGMAWSPAPSCAASHAASAAAQAAGTAVAAGPTIYGLQENIRPAFPGFRIKPDPEGQQAAHLGPAWPVRGVVGVRVKPDPDGAFGNRLASMRG